MKRPGTTRGAKDRLLAVTTAVADLWNRPFKESGRPGRDNLRETQLLLNETLVYRDDEQDWYLVEALEQKKLVHGDTLSGYPGWVKKGSAAFIDEVPAANAIVSRGVVAVTGPSSRRTGGIYLPAGAFLHLNGERVDDLAGFYLPGGGVGWVHSGSITAKDLQESPRKKRERIISAAMSFIDTPYLWGGRSTRMPPCENRTGMDCSGFTNLAYRTGGMDIPRNAHDQWRLARKISPDELKTADLVFVSPEGHGGRVTHVMLYLDEERFIEAAETGLPVGIRTFGEKFGRTLKDIIENNSFTGKKQLHYGSFIRDE